MNVDSEESRQSIGGAWIFTILYCAFSWGMFYYAVTKWKEVPAILITGFFAAFGVVYIVVTIRYTVGQAKFGEVRFLMERPEPSIGGQLKGSVTLPRAALEGKTVVAELMCTRHSYGGENTKGVTNEPMWAARRSFPIRRKPGGGSAAILIDIPDDQQPTLARPRYLSWSSGEPVKIFWSWSLRVTVDLSGVDFDRTYPIIVKPLQPGAPPAAAAAAPVAARATAAASVAMPAVAPAVRAAPPMPAAVDLNPMQAAALAAAPKRAVQASRPVDEKIPGEVQGEDSGSIWVLIAANLVAVAGALFWGWRVEVIVFLYWMENLVIGAFNLLRILFARPDRSEAEARGLTVTGAQLLAAKAMFGAFFAVHYGVFCYAHGEILVGFFPGAERASGLAAAVAAVLRELGMFLAVLAIAASHGYSFFRNYLGRREFDGVNFAGLMTRPYKRIFVTHIFIIAGGFLLSAMKLPVAALVAFVVLKVFADIHFHRREHAAPAGAAA